jgi:chitin disaccharide deacetylase
MDTLFHADDFGIDEEQSRRILACGDATDGIGALNSLSILANSPQFDECASLLDPYIDRIHVGVHLNVVEGRCCADPALIPLLVDDQGFFKRGFVSMLLASIGPDRVILRGQLQQEIIAQIDRVVRRFPSLAQSLRIDSHQHFHLIPIMFEAVMGAVEERGYDLEYLRIPAEPLIPFLDRRIFFTLRPVNWIKHGILNILWRFDRHHFPSGYQCSAVFCGILLSGHMDAQRLAVLKPAFECYAQRHNASLEFLFHPGAVISAMECLDPRLSGFVSFYLSEGRSIEAAALEGLR